MYTVGKGIVRILINCHHWLNRVKMRLFEILLNGNRMTSLFALHGLWALLGLDRRRIEISLLWSDAMDILALFGRGAFFLETALRGRDCDALRDNVRGVRVVVRAVAEPE